MNVIILRGISGSGKTHVAEEIENTATEETIIFSADHFWMDGEDYKFNPADLQKAHDNCLIEFTRLIAYPEDPKRAKRFGWVVVDNTNTRAAEIAPYYQLAQAYGHNVHILSILCDLNWALERNIHETPNHVIWKQFQRMHTEELPTWWRHSVHTNNVLSFLEMVDGRWRV